MHPDLPAELVLKGRAGELKVRLALPTSMGLRYEVVYASAESAPRAHAAALGLCSLSIRKHVPYRGQGLVAYGLSVTDWLLSEGVDYLAILDAGRLAWVHCSYGLIDDKEIDEAEGFSSPGTEGSTS